MILNKQLLTISEAKEYVKNLEENLVLEQYFKKFAALPVAKAKKLKEAITDLNNPKIKEEDVIKVVDFLPETSEELNKIFNEVSLTEEEATKLLELVKSA